MLAVIALLLAIASPAQAHRLIVFATADGADIHGRVRYAGGDAAGVQVRIEDAAGRRLATLEPGPDGRFHYRAATASAHRIVASTPDGHRADWQITAAELAAGFASAPRTQNASGPLPDATPPPATTEATDGIDPQLAAAIERAVARALVPLREELAETREALRMADILGGIGWILGVTGLALWWRARGRP
jgi:nickel transport protein